MTLPHLKDLVNKLEPLLKKRNQLITRYQNLYDSDDINPEVWQREEEEMASIGRERTKIQNQLSKILNDEGETDVTALAKKIVAGIKTFDSNEHNAVLLKRAQRVEMISVYRKYYPAQWVYRVKINTVILTQYIHKTGSPYNKT